MGTADSIATNYLLQHIHARRIDELNNRFPELERIPNRNYLLLYKYIGEPPHCFYSESVYKAVLSWLSGRDINDRTELQKYFLANESRLNLAFLYLEEINQYVWHDYFEKLDDYETIKFIDQQIHPTYLRLIEGVLKPLAHMFAYFLRTDRGKKPAGLELFSIIEEIERSALCFVMEPCKRVIRNAIAHGGVTYLQKQIKYHDDKGNEETCDDSEVIAIFDRLLDTCNALSLALSIFLFSRQQYGYKLIRELLLQELKIETKLPWWQISGCTPSGFDNLNQLLIYARPTTFDYQKVMLSALQSAILAENFAPGYDRYFFSLRSTMSFPGWAAFNGLKLRELRENPVDVMEKYADAIEEGSIFFWPKIKLPKFINRIETFISIIKLNLPVVVQDIRKQAGRPEIQVREARIHRNSWGCVLNASVYVKPLRGNLSQDNVRQIKRKIIRKAFSEARNRTTCWRFFRFLPLGFARISVFSRNYRRRRLLSYGLGQDLVCTIQLQRIGRIQNIDIIGSIIEQKGKYRIAWNRSWLEKNTDSKKQL